jgi:hypothetical protein
VRPTGKPVRPRRCEVPALSGLDVHDLRIVVADLVGELGVDAPASTNVTTAGLYRNTTRMLPPG